MHENQTQLYRDISGKNYCLDFEKSRGEFLSTILSKFATQMFILIENNLVDNDN